MCAFAQTSLYGFVGCGRPERNTTKAALFLCLRLVLLEVKYLRTKKNIIMDSFFRVLDISVFSGVVVGWLLSTAILGLVLLLRRGQGKVTLLSCAVVALLASFLSLQSSLAVGEWRLKKMIDQPLEQADAGVRFISKVTSGINVGVLLANLIPGVHLPEVPEIDSESIVEIKQDIDSHRIRHLYYILVGIIGAGVVMYLTLDTEKPSKRRQKIDFYNE